MENRTAIGSALPGPFRSLLSLAAPLAVGLLLQLLPAGLASVSAAEGSGVTLEDELALIQAESRVESASRHSQEVREAPAAVTVVGAEQIRRYGYLNIDDLLRSLPGFTVTNDRNYSYLGVRGFGLPSDYNSRVLLLLDGHRMNNPIYGTASLGWESGIDIGAVDRLEAVRGPASALYGTNAMFGTISVATEKPGPAANREVSLVLAEPGLEKIAGRARGKEGGIAYSLDVSAMQRAGHHILPYPVFADLDLNTDGRPDYSGFTVDADEESSLGFLGRLGIGSVELTAFVGDRRKTVPTGAFDTVFGSDAFRTRDTLAYLDLASSGRWGAHFDWSARATLDYYGYTASYPYPLGYDSSAPAYTSPPHTMSKDDQHAWWAGAEAQGQYTGLSAQRLMIGGRFTHTWATMTYFDVEPFLSYLDTELRYYELDGYLQDEIDLSRAFRVVLGVNGNLYDRGLFKGKVERLNPKAGLIVRATPATTFKALYGEAFRVPTLAELSYDDGGASQVRNPNLAPEIMKTVELVLEQELPAAVRLRASVYQNRIQGLIRTTEIDPDGGVVQFQNSPDIVLSRGVELEIRKAAAAGLSGFASLAFQRTEDDRTGERFPNSPEVTANAGLSLPLQRDRTYLSLEGRFVGARRTVDLADEVGSHVVLNATLSHRHLAPNLDVSFAIRNLLDERFSDPGSFDHIQKEIPQDGRSLAFQASYRF